MADAPDIPVDPDGSSYEQPFWEVGEGGVIGAIIRVIFSLWSKLLSWISGFIGGIFEDTLMASLGTAAIEIGGDSIIMPMVPDWL